MSETRPRLIVVDGDSTDFVDHDALDAIFEIIHATDRVAALQLIAGSPDQATFILESSGGSTGPSGVLGTITDALVLVREDGSITWSDPRFNSLPEPIRSQAVGWCTDTGSTARRTHLQDGEQHWEVLRSPSTEGGWLCLVMEVTEDRKHQLRLQTITAAGSKLLHLDRASVASLNVAERLRLLETKIVQHVREELRFDNFEIRLLDPRSRQLELVISENINPLKLGEVIYARETGNGISGWVAAKGTSYRCGNVKADPLYREGLDDASSSLTVPLRMHNEIIGVFNIESNTPENFGERDQELAELFGEYVAIALHMLDLLVVERFTTNEQAARNLLADMNEPMKEIEDVAGKIEETSGATNEPLINRLSRAVASMRARIEASVAGPRSILDAEQELQRLQPDPAMGGKHIVVADDDENIRTPISRILVQLGCTVTACENGRATLDQFDLAAKGGTAIDLVLSDIKMPDLSGYEIFQETHERFPGIPVILMTGFGYDPNHSIVRASQEGMQSVLFKPFRTAQLIEAVKKALKAKV